MTTLPPRPDGGLDNIPPQARDYTRPDGAVMREVYPGEFVNLTVLLNWGFKIPDATPAKTKLDRFNSTLDVL